MLYMNRPFYRYDGHIELISFKKYYGMLKEHERDSTYSLSIYAPLIFGPIFLKVFLERYCNGRKDRCAVLEVKMIAFFPRNIVKFSFCLKSARKY